MRQALIALFCLLLLCLGLAWWALYASLPRGDRFTLAGLSGPVNLHYDRWQRPFVRADSFVDALTAQGWLHARHRLWQMELLRRAGRGRLAEMLGEDALPADRQLWRFGVPDLGQRFADAASPVMRQRISAYVAGINAGMAEYTLLPPEFQLLQFKPAPWTLEDVYAISALLAFQSAGNAEQELLRLALLQALPPERYALFEAVLSELPGYPFVQPPSSGAAPRARAPGPAAPRFDSSSPMPAVAPDAAAVRRHLPRLSLGSNAWVVGPARSASGYPLFAFDSHDALGLPGLFYEVHLYFGQRELHGWSIPGLPGVVNGYNASIAWGLTNTGDSQDLFLETRGPGADSFVEDGRVYAGRSRHIVLPVRGGAAETLTLVYSRNGPLINEEPPIALAWTALQVDSPRGDALLTLNLAEDWESFNAALDAHVAPVLNAIYADKEGNIGLRVLGVLPDRALGVGLKPLPASASHGWRGFIDGASMPRWLNPAKGYLAAANGRFGPTGASPLVAADHAPGYRMQRLEDVLSGAVDFSLEDMQSLQTDWWDPQAAKLLPALLAALPPQPSLAPATGLLKRWVHQPEAAPDSAAAVLFQSWYLELAQALLKPRLGNVLYQRLLQHNYVLNAAVDTLLRTRTHDDWWPAPRGEVLARTLSGAVDRLERSQGPIASWRLDRAQSVALAHDLSQGIPALRPLLSVPAQPWGGSPATVGRASYTYRSPFVVNKAATVRAVGEMAGRPRFRSVMPAGQSGHPLSAHYSDQFPHWLAGRLLDITPPVSEQSVTLLPTPASAP